MANDVPLAKISPMIASSHRCPQFLNFNNEMLTRTFPPKLTSSNGWGQFLKQKGDSRYKISSNSVNVTNKLVFVSDHYKVGQFYYKMGQVLQSGISSLLSHKIQLFYFKAYKMKL